MFLWPSKPRTPSRSQVTKRPTLKVRYLLWLVHKLLYVMREADFLRRKFTHFFPFYASHFRNWPRHTVFLSLLKYVAPASRSIIVMIYPPPLSCHAWHTLWIIPYLTWQVEFIHKTVISKCRKCPSGHFFSSGEGDWDFQKTNGHFRFWNVFERTFSFEGGWVKKSQKSKCPTDINCEWSLVDWVCVLLFECGVI